MQKTSAEYNIAVTVHSQFLANHMEDDLERYAFSYTVTLHNKGTVAAQLISRHWIITDGHGETKEIHGSGVVGQTPHLLPGTCFEYTSGTILDTPLGTMQGSYQMVATDGTYFEAIIAPFSLIMPAVVH
jgi:ApaG protein